MKNIIYIILVLFLASCGGSGTSSSSQETEQKETITIDIVGKVVDGYIKDATVCLDTNINGTCDTNEKTVTSLDDGSFSFQNVSLEKNQIIPIISKGGVDTAIDSEYKGYLKASIDTSSTVFSTIIINPFSDLIISSYLNGKNKSEIESKIASGFSLDSSILNRNPMENRSLFAKTQELEHMKDILESLSIKIKSDNINESQLQNLRKNIKLAIINAIDETNKIDYGTMVDNLQTYENISFSQEQKDFLIAQFTQNQSTFNSLASNNSISLDDLGSLQMVINEEVKELHSNINSSNYKMIPLSSSDKLISKSLLSLEHIENKEYNTPPLLPSFGQ